MDPLTAYRQKQQMMKQKKGPNYVGIGLGIAGAVVLIILVVVYSQSSTPPSQRTAAPGTYTKVNLPDSEKMKVYSELPRYKDMLKSNGGSAMDAYRVVGKLHNISASDVQQIEAEGSSKGWSR